MKRASAVGMALVVAVLLAWTATPVQAAPTSTSQDPAQLSTAAVVFVKVDPKTGTDTILVFNRQQAGDATTTGSAISVRVRFYDSECTLKFDNNVPLTPQGFFAAFASTLFGVTAPGVMLADFTESNNATPVANSKFAASGVVIDGNFGALYERQGSPLLQQNPRGPNPFFSAPGSARPRPVWGGFSTQDIDDWFIGGFTMLQMLCPGSSEFDGDDTPGFLAEDMNALGTSDHTQGDEISFGSFFPVVNVYDVKEVLKRSIHNVDCFCNTDSAFFGKDSRGTGYPGDFADILVSMKAVGVGTFHWNNPTNLAEDADLDFPGAVIAWRVIGTGGATPVYWDARLRTTPSEVNRNENEHEGKCC